jgi:hypothetical protein
MLLQTSSNRIARITACFFCGFFWGNTRTHREMSPQTGGVPTLTSTNTTRRPDGQDHSGVVSPDAILRRRRRCRRRESGRHDDRQDGDEDRSDGAQHASQERDRAEVMPAMLPRAAHPRAHEQGLRSRWLL